MQADLAAFSLGGARDLPTHAPEDTLVWALAGRAATLVVVAGVERVRDGYLVNPPLDAFDAVRDAGVALAAWGRDTGAGPT
jgi:hypothetical protein